METVRFYFSFRSPYAWFAFRRIEEALAGLPVEMEYIPCFPPRDYKNPRSNPAKGAYMDVDVARIAGAYGLRPNWPKPFDADWIPPHTAYLFAQDQGRGREFALAAYALRFEQGRDIGTDEAVGEAARACGLDPEATIRAAGDPALRKRVMEGMANRPEDGVFGVPFFVYRGQAFWGNDRIDWLVRAIREQLGEPVPDLEADPLAPACDFGETQAPEATPRRRAGS